MIARLEGVLVERDPPHVVIDCGGVGYEVVCSSYTLAGLPADGERVTLRVFTHATENKLALFGFGGTQERALFDLLITVKNVGPSTAIAILGSATPRDLAGLIAREDVAGLTRIKGIGKKTAEMLVVELRDKCAEALLGWDAGDALRPVALPAGAARGKRRPASHPLLEDVRLALVGMGFQPAEVDRVVVELPVPEGATLEGLLRQALKGMPR